MSRKAERSVKQCPVPTDPEKAERDARRAIIMETALGYEGLGMPVLPVRPGSKQPARRGWKDYATDDALAIYRRFSRSPDANVGLLMGRQVRLGRYVFALDVDPRNGGTESLGHLLDRLRLPGFPPTATAPTGGGGTRVAAQ